MEVRPGYKQTEVGVIPQDWGTAVLLDVAECLDNVRVPLNETQRQRMQGDVPYCGANGVLDFVNDFVIDDDIILVAEDGGYFDEFASRPIAYRMRGKCWVNNHAHILKARPGHDQGFLFYSLVHKNILPFLASGTRAKLNKSEMERIVVPAPPTEAEQRAIAAALSDVDALLGGLDRLIAKKRDLKQAAMQQLLTGQTRLPGFHGEWEVKRLGDILEKIVGGGTPSRANPAFWGAEIPWVTVKDFATFHPRQSQESITKLGLRNSASNLIPRGTLITSTRMALGKAVVYEVDVAINQDLKGLFLKPEYNVLFLTYWFEHFGSMIDELGSGSTVKGISLGELRKFPFQAPPLPEQTAIAAVLSDMDAELAALEARRNKTRALKQAMMQELLTGKTRLVKPEAAHA